MPNCIFCSAPLNSRTKPEHVLLDALGGRKTTTQVICSDCNGSFGSGVDRVLAGQFSTVRNLLQLKSGTGKDAPALKRVQSGDEQIKVYGDGTLELLAKPFHVAKTPDGWNVQIVARSPEHVELLIPHVAAAIGFPEANVRRQLLESEFRWIQKQPSTVQLSESYGGAEAFRSA